MNAKLKTALLTGAALLTLSAGPVAAASATTSTNSSTQVQTGSKTLNEAEKTDISGQEAVDATKDAASSAGKALSDAATATETKIRELFSNGKMEQIEGAAVRDANGDSVGEVDGVVRAKSSDDLYFIVDVGGFLGLGEREVALPATSFTSADDHLVLANMTKAELENHEVYNASRYAPVSVDAAGTASTKVD
ncbi:MAG: PRC-barrel domain-containing protein [Alphaproteobacteria bacterium]|nr:PRC-barrel domain-containing protein [Alphaproteobacteria bacterium]